MGKVTDFQAMATAVKQNLTDIATIEGHIVVPDEVALADFIESVGDSENIFKNRAQDSPNGRGYIPSHDVRRK